MHSILIVDDNPLDLEGVRDLMDWEELGLQVIESASDGMEGFEKAVALNPDIILTDVDMPRLDGLKMAEMIKRSHSKSKFVFMSCFDDFNYIKEAMDLDAFRYVLKPIKLNELTNVIRKIKRVIDEDERIARAEKQLRTSLPALREQFFREALYGKWTVESEARAQAEGVGIPPEMTFGVAFLEIDHYESRYARLSAEQKNELIDRTMSQLSAVIPAERILYMANHSYRNAVLVLSEGPDGPEGAGSIRELMDKGRQWLNETMDVQTTIGVSPHASRVTLLAERFHQAEHAVKHKLFGMGNRVLGTADFTASAKAEEHNPQTLKKELNALVENGDPDDASKLVGELYTWSVNQTESRVKSFTASVVHTLQTICAEKNHNLKDIFGEEGELWEKLYRMDTVAEIQMWLTRLLESICKLSQDLEKNKHKKVVEEIKQYIKDHHSGIENVEQIAAHFYFSSRYANHIFKQHTGSTIFDYLISARLEAAKSLLLMPNAKVYDVSEKVGYQNNSYFCSLFKQNTGLTPKQYIDKYGRSS